MAKKELRNYNRRYAREYNFLRSSWYMFFLYMIATPFFAIFYDFKVTGRENLPKEKKDTKFIYAGNHVSIFDPFLIPFATKRLIAWMAKKELFDPKEKFYDLIISLGAFAVDREKPEIATFKTVKDIFTTKWGLGVFPQGGTRPYGKLEGIKRGFGVIAKNAKADIIPVVIGNFSGYPDFKFPIKKQTFELHVCKPISYKLPVDEIEYRWCEEISKHADYENCYPKPERFADEQEFVEA